MWLSANHIVKSGVDTFSRALQSNTSLKSLFFYGVLLSPAGTVASVEWLIAHSTLHNIQHIQQHTTTHNTW